MTNVNALEAAYNATTFKKRETARGLKNLNLSISKTWVRELARWQRCHCWADRPARWSRLCDYANCN